VILVPRESVDAWRYRKNRMSVKSATESTIVAVSPTVSMMYITSIVIVKTITLIDRGSVSRI
jgi:hypothetical protein